jgi:hypothetical protein
MSRTANDNTKGIKSLENDDAASGSYVTNPQRDVNSLSSYTGRPEGSAKDALPAWSTSEIGTPTDDLTERAIALTQEFIPATGHNHDGTPGSGGQVSASKLSDLNYYRADWQTVVVSGVTGSSRDVSSEFSTKSAAGGASTPGVLTAGAYNRVVLTDLDTQTAFEDAEGQRVFGRLTFASGVWTLSFYTNEAGVETPYSFASPATMNVYFREVYTLANLPTIPADLGALPSLDATADIVDATPLQRGLVNTTTQSFAGTKTFTGNVNVDGVTRLATTLQQYLYATSGIVISRKPFRSNRVALASGATQAVVPFSEDMGTEDYTVNCSFETSDSLPIFLQYIVTNRTSGGFTVIFNAPTDSPNYKLHYQAQINH